MDCFILVKTCYEGVCDHIIIRTFRNLHPPLPGFLEQGKPLNVVSLKILEIDYGILHTLIIDVRIKKDVSLIKLEFEDSYKNDKELSITIQIMFSS